MWYQISVQWEPKFDHRSRVPTDLREKINFTGLFSPLLPYLILSAAFKLNKTSIALLQNMVISPLHKKWKKEKVPFEGQTRSTIQHTHTVIYHQRGPFQEKWMKSWWVFLLGCLGPTGLPGYWKSHPWVREGFSHSRIEEFSHIIKYAFDSIAARRRKFKAISLHFILRTGKHGQ